MTSVKTIILNDQPRTLGNERPAVKYVFENPTGKPVNVTLSGLSGPLTIAIYPQETNPWWAVVVSSRGKLTRDSEGKMSISYPEVSYQGVSVEVEE